MFHLDPIELLKSDKWDSLIRTAAYNVAVRDENERNSKAAQQADT